jgi:hypothetical protein
MKNRDRGTAADRKAFTIGPSHPALPSNDDAEAQEKTPRAEYSLVRGAVAGALRRSVCQPVARFLRRQQEKAWRSRFSSLQRSLRAADDVISNCTGHRQQRTRTSSGALRPVPCRGTFPAAHAGSLFGQSGCRVPSCPGKGSGVRAGPGPGDYPARARSCRRPWTRFLSLAKGALELPRQCHCRRTGRSGSKLAMIFRADGRQGFPRFF